MLITRLSPRGNPSTHIIDLTTCADVCSLALSQISANERALLPDKGAGLKVFDIQFEGTRKEMFAATSVQQRAGWVSAIW
jgi:cytochrome oxidase Cu insertion factor (SCO1/SenC/PrrC family)